MSENEVLYVRPSKKSSKSNGDDSSTSDDVWDDTLLIKAYDKAVHLAHNAFLKNMEGSTEKGKDVKSKKKLKWNVGDKCRSQYSEDNNYYEADIIDIIEDLGLCIVKYVGYENEEKVPFHRLKPSKGDVFRSLQLKQALQDDGSNGDGLVERESQVDHHSKSRKKKNFGKGASKEKLWEKNSIEKNSLKKEIDYCSSRGIHTPPIGMTIPPPPPPHMFSNPSDDISESEAMSAMLMSWYMSGYHTGYYQGLKAARKK